MQTSIKTLLIACALGASVTMNPLTAGISYAMDYKDISAQQAHEMMTSGAKLRIIDVRTPEEFAQGHVPNAVNVPLDDIRSGKIPFVMGDKNATYLLYCRSGRRSGMAAGVLADKGWKNIYNFGGILDWPYEVVR